jgi:hypothetical protein
MEGRSRCKVVVYLGIIVAKCSAKQEDMDSLLPVHRILCGEMSGVIKSCWRYDSPFTRVKDLRGYRTFTVVSRMIHISLAVQYIFRHAQSTTNATPKAIHQSYRPVPSRRLHDSLTYQNRIIKQKKNPTQTFQPTPVFSAMRSIRFIVPRKRFLVPSN